jgi:hypothetical protein
VVEHGQGGSYTYSLALRDWPAGLLSVYPARVFAFRGARMALRAFGPGPNGLVSLMWERTIHADTRGQTVRTVLESRDG